MAVDFSNYVATQKPAVTTIDKGAGLDALSSGQQNLSSSYQTFLTLLTTQLKNQDPTSPLDTNNFTQQLVQMTGVQQQLLSNQLLKQLVNANGGNVQDAVGLIGKTATAMSSSATLKDGSASWTYNLPNAASRASMSIKDASGRVVWTGNAPSLGAGDHSFSWNGKNGVGVTQPNGPYTLELNAVDSNGSAIAATSSVTGTVTAVRQESDGPHLTIGGADVPLAAVTAVTSSNSSSS